MKILYIHTTICSHCLYIHSSPVQAMLTGTVVLPIKSWYQPAVIATFNRDKDLALIQYIIPQIGTGGDLGQATLMVLAGFLRLLTTPFHWSS